MSEHPPEEPDAALVAALGAFVASGELWEDPPAGLEDAVAEAIASESSRASATATGPGGSTDDGRRSGALPWWLGAAAASALVVAGIAVVARAGDDPSEDTDDAVIGASGLARGDAVRIDLEGTDAAPTASAEAEVSARPAGLKIVIDIEGLGGAPDGHFYEAWVSGGGTRVSAGTFHLREGDGAIELWAGVTDPSFDTLAVTLEPLDDDAGSSGDVRLIGQFELPEG